MTPSGIEPATFRFVTQHLNHCVTSAPKVFEWSTIIINYHVITNVYYYIISAQQNYCNSNEGFPEDCDKEENMAVTVAATASCLKRTL